MKTCFCALMYILNMKEQKHACFHVFSPFSAYFYPHYIITIEGSIEMCNAIIYTRLTHIIIFVSLTF